MSNPKVKVGSSFTGTTRGTVSFGGTTNVETDNKSSYEYDIGGKAENCNVEQGGSVTFTESLTVTSANANKEEKVDQNTESTPQVERYKLENEEDVHIGSKVIAGTKDVRFRIKGHMTIFNQEFKHTPSFRDGSANDVTYLVDTFRGLGIEPLVRSDLKYKDIVKEIDTLSRTDFSKCKLFVCIYMSHGQKSGIVSAADKDFDLKKTIIDPIMRNGSLNGVAKIFVTVACRGAANYEECDVEEFDGHILSTADGIDYSNCIISYSTYEGHVSKRTRIGTYFIQSLCDNINGDNGDTKIHSLFAKVNGKLTEMFKQVPEFKTTMGDICFRDLASTPI